MRGITVVALCAFAAAVTLDYLGVPKLVYWIAGLLLAAALGIRDRRRDKERFPELPKRERSPEENERTSEERGL